MNETMGIGAVKRLLKEYNFIKGSTEFLKGEVKRLETVIYHPTSAAIAKYGASAGGGEAELNGVETAASSLIANKEKLNEYKRKIVEQEAVTSRIDLALLAVSEECRGIIIDKYIQGYPWRDIAVKAGYSEEWAKKRGRNGIVKLCQTINGTTT